jgi:enoyl-CoA hydratase/carnithine racemase
MTDSEWGMSPNLTLGAEVAILNLGAGENRLNLPATQAVNECLDQVESSSCTALVTCADGKIWSNGMDTAWMADHPERAAETLAAAEKLMARILALPMPTVAALQGHCFAGGLLLALAHDLRIMRADRGFVCFPEVNFGAVFSRGMADLVEARLGSPAALRAAVLAQRYDGEGALRIGIVDELCAADVLVDRAVELARNASGAQRDAVAGMKTMFNAKPLTTLGQAPPQHLVDALLKLGKQ